MESPYLIWVLCLLTSTASFCYSDDVSVKLNDDVLGLVVFKSDLHDPSSHLTSWTEDADSPCSWDHIKCNPSTGRVSEIDLAGLGLSGKIGRGLQKLQFLKVLSLAGNNFSGEIGTQFGLIPSLRSLNLSRNGFSGQIGIFPVNTSSIRFLDLSENALSGTVPEGLFESCASLRFLSLAGNLFEGNLPMNLYKCSLLNTLILSRNHFSGNVEFGSGFWSLTRLRVLDLSRNGFSGNVGLGVSRVHNLRELSLGGNQFSGSVPYDVGLCAHLNVFDICNNSFSGSLPGTLQSLKSINILNLSNNQFSGDFPNWIGNMTGLEIVFFDNNAFTGTLPEAMGGLKRLTLLSVVNNKLTGAIPMGLCECVGLSVLNLRENGLNGSIPEGVFGLGLVELDLSRNGLSGSIPAGSGRLLESLEVLDLSGNRLAGRIPAETGFLSKLRYLNLSWNGFESRVPPEMGGLGNLTVVDLRQSAVFGEIPGELCDSGSLRILQLDGNLLEGGIPEEIGNCSSLDLLSLSHNALTGPIPKSIANLTMLKILELQANELTGEVPQELGRLENLLAVNISFNKLTGRLPAGGIFPSLGQSSLQGNLGICSPLLTGPCTMNVPKPLVLDPNAYPSQTGSDRRPDEPPRPGRFAHHMFLSVSAIIAISAAMVIVIGVVIVSLLNVSARKRLAFVENALESMCSSSSRSGCPAAGKLVLFDSKSPQDWITDPEALLSKASEIGEGVFGTVYKIPLGGQGRFVAIKKLVSTNIIQYPEDFDREVRILGTARHASLVPLKGYYWTPQVQLLVTEYAPGGSLQARLHERLPSSPPLPWASRFRIVLGTAKGLAYLHHSFRPPIIHYNLKPSNILLDGDDRPMVSDFGLAALLTRLDKHVTSRRFQTALGYMAPELACRSLRVNEKCDVYGFGVVVLEVVTGRRPVEYGEDNVVILSDHVKALLERGSVLECVDRTMGEYPEEEVLPVLKLALVCTSQVPSTRPSMAEVVQILQLINTPLPQRREPY